MPLVGTPSDDLDAVLATGRTDVTTVFVSLSARHPDGDDAEYLSGAPSITGLNSHGWPRWADRYEWCRRRHAGQHGRRTSSTTRPSTT
jgi:hypothetical protein